VTAAIAAKRADRPGLVTVPASDPAEPAPFVLAALVPALWTLDFASVPFAMMSPFESFDVECDRAEIAGRRTCSPAALMRAKNGAVSLRPQGNTLAGRDAQLMCPATQRASLASRRYCVIT
jgi:hypothetical protein